ncbi:MAG: hypothetical protein ACRD3W_04900, partial [Terriglobales bacterium]
LSSEAEAAASLALDQDMLSFSLATGQVDERHPLYRWLLNNGATEAELAALRTDPIVFDVYGVNFYPWSSHQISLSADGVVRNSVPGDGHQLLEVLRAVSNRTPLPLYVTETSAPRYQRESWMREVDDAVRIARIDGIPVIGLTWFPLFTMIDWEYRTGDKPIEQYLLDLGLADARFENGVLVRRPTPLFARFRALIERGTPAIGGDVPRSGWRAFWHRIWCR